MIGYGTMMKLIKALFLLVPLLALLAPTVYAANSTTVTIFGQVSETFPFGTITITVRADASGTALTLSGSGTDGPPPNSPPGNPLACQFPLTGSIAGTTVTLTGTVTQSSFAGNIGTPVTVIGDSSGGAITFVFGPIAGGPFAGATLILTGTGTVVIRTG